MMLPSGNDAAMVLAEYFGSSGRDDEHISVDATREEPVFNNLTEADSSETGAPVQARQNDPVLTFVTRMNDRAKEMQLLTTKYANPHGVSGNFVGINKE